MECRGGERLIGTWGWRIIGMWKYRRREVDEEGGVGLGKEIEEEGEDDDFSK